MFKAKLFYFKSTRQTVISITSSQSVFFSFESIRLIWVSSLRDFSVFLRSRKSLKRVTTLQSSLLILHCLGFSKIKKSSLLVIWIWLSKTVIISNRISMVPFRPRPGKIVMKKLMTPHIKCCKDYNFTISEVLVSDWKWKMVEWVSVELLLIPSLLIWPR